MSDSIPSEITVEEANSRRASDEAPIFLDVREPSEVATAHIDPDLHIPLQSLEEGWQQIPKERPVIVYCHHGMRSLHATKFLHAMGIHRAQSMSGGIDAWSLKIDSSIPRY